MNAFATRMTHAGRVCSGDFLTTATGAGYLIEQGSFLKWFTVASTVLTVGILGIALLLVFGRLGYNRMVNEK